MLLFSAHELYNYYMMALLYLVLTKKGIGIKKRFSILWGDDGWGVGARFIAPGVEPLPNHPKGWRNKKKNRICELLT
jgi:hypothetical protein